MIKRQGQIDTDLLVQRGIDAFKAQSYDAALSCLNEALTAQPNHIIALVYRGVILGNLGRLKEAVASFDQALVIAPNQVDALSNRGHALARLGRHDEALDSLGKALLLEMNNLGALVNAGTLLEHLGRHEEALICLDQALTVSPSHLGALTSRGAALRSLGRHLESLSCFDAVVRAIPNDPQAQNNKGLALGSVGRHEEAVACFDAALAIAPDLVDARYHRVNALERLGRYEEALSDLKSVLLLDKSNVGALTNAGALLEHLDRHEEALIYLDRALSVSPHHLGALANRGTVLRSLCRYLESLSCFDAVAKATPNEPQALYNKGLALGTVGQHEEAAACFDAALAVAPDMADARSMRGFELLAIGNLPQGFRDREARWETMPLRQAKIQSRAALWLGDAPVEGKTVLLHAEQGIGDVIQFARYASLVADQGAHVLLAVFPALKELMKGLRGIEAIFSDVALPAHDFHCPLMSLPLAFGTTIETIPAQIPYLSATPENAAIWGHRLGAKRRPRVGIVWAGQQTSPFKRRDIDLQVLLPLLNLELEFVSLQKEPRVSDRPLIETLPQINRAGESLVDYADTAGLISNLDLVIAVDTSVAHLAGAMGKPVWILLSKPADWRWLQNRTDSPWYPTARLFRQGESGEWRGVINNVRSALASLVV